MKKLIISAVIIFSVFFIIRKLHSQNKVTVSINRNFEAFYIMNFLSDMDNYILSKGYASFPLTTQLNFDLKNKYINHFQPYKNSSPILYFNSLLKKDFILSRTFQTVLMADSEMNLRKTCWFDQLELPSSYKDSILLFVEELKKFRNTTRFDQFFNENNGIYESILKKQKEKVDINKVINSIENYFGWGLPAYHVNLVTMMWPGGISLEYKEQCTDSLPEVYVCIGPKRVVNGLPDFGTVEEYKSVIVHELVHAFVWPYCTCNRNLIEKYKSLYDKEVDVFKRNACHDWFIAFNELLTRTVEIIIISCGNNHVGMNMANYQSDKLGFHYIPAIYEILESQKKINEKDFSFEIIIPLMLESLNNLQKLKSTGKYILKPSHHQN